MPDEIYNFDPLPAEEAIAIIQQRAPLRLAAFKRLLPELRAHAFAVSGIENFDALQGMRDLIATIPAGADYKKVRKQIAATLGAHIPLEDDLFEDAEAAAKHKAALMRRAEMIVRTQVTQAYSVVAYRELDEFRDVFPYWKYITVSDGRVRASHAALNNTILRNDHPFWKTHYPPWEFGCRCQVVGITEWEAGEERKRDARRPVEERQVMEGDLLKRLEDEGTLVRKVGGNPLAIDVSSPRDRGESDAWHFDPGDLAASFADLASRYDATVWRAFRAWAAGQDVGPSGNLLQWIEGGKPARSIISPSKPAGKAIPTRAAQKPKAAKIEVNPLMTQKEVESLAISQVEQMTADELKAEAIRHATNQGRGKAVIESLQRSRGGRDARSYAIQGRMKAIRDEANAMVDPVKLKQQLDKLDSTGDLTPMKFPTPRTP